VGRAINDEHVGRAINDEHVGRAINDEHVGSSSISISIMYKSYFLFLNCYLVTSSESGIP